MNRIFAFLPLAATAAFAMPALAAAQPAPHAPPHQPGAGAGHSWGQHGRAQGAQMRYPDVVRIERGHRVPHFWFGPQFHVRNWQLYGFAQPGADQRWVRYYDDAYLVDGEGLVADGHYGLDWDRYGERWDHAGGVPHYVGDGDFDPGPEDYAWVEAEGDRAYAEVHQPRADHRAHHGRRHVERRVERRVERHHAPAPHGYSQRVIHHPAPPPAHGYGYGHGYYGYGYPGYWGMVTETITTVTTHPATTTRTYVEERVAPRTKVRRVHRPAPPPPRGERG